MFTDLNRCGELVKSGFDNASVEPAGWIVGILAFKPLFDISWIRSTLHVDVDSSCNKLDGSSQCYSSLDRHRLASLYWQQGRPERDDNRFERFGSCISHNLHANWLDSFIWPASYRGRGGPSTDWHEHCNYDNKKGQQNHFLDVVDQCPRLSFDIVL